MYQNKSAINFVKFAFDANYSFKHQREFSARIRAVVGMIISKISLIINIVYSRGYSRLSIPSNFPHYCLLQILNSH